MVIKEYVTSYISIVERNLTWFIYHQTINAAGYSHGHLHGSILRYFQYCSASSIPTAELILSIFICAFSCAVIRLSISQHRKDFN